MKVDLDLKKSNLKATDTVEEVELVAEKETDAVVEIDAEVVILSGISHTRRRIELHER
jgi:hypothetical protein